MKVNQLMTTKPACVRPETPLKEVAHLMLAHDCGEIPVVDSTDHPVGVVTDRDITVRTVARGINPLDVKAGDVMTTPVVTVKSGASLDDCCDLMEKHQIRRMVVVDDSGCLCGIVAQADVALHAGKKDTAELVKDVSKPAGSRETVNV